MSAAIYVVIQYDYADHEAEDDERYSHCGFISCHTSKIAANEAAEDWAREACGMDEDDDEFEDRRDNVNIYCPGAFDSTFLMGEYHDVYSMRIQVEEKPLYGSLSLLKPDRPKALAAPATTSTLKNTAAKAGVSYQPRFGQLASVPVDSKPNGLRGARVSIVGTLESMHNQNAGRAIEILGGSIPYSLRNADYVVVGAVGNETGPIERRELQLSGFGQKINENEFWQLMADGVPEDKVLRVFDAELDERVRYAIHGTPDPSDVEDEDDSGDEDEDENEDEDHAVCVEPPAKRQKI